ncbi:hypothetical protein D3C84_636550 [compost metagenome]
MLHVPSGRTEQPGVQTIGLADDGRQITEVRQIDLAVGERLVDHRSRPFEEAPLNLDALFGEGLFEDLLIAQYIHDSAPAVLGTGAEIRHGDADFLEFAGIGREGQ